MGRRIYKWHLRHTPFQIISLPKDTHVLSVQLQSDRLEMWVTQVENENEYADYFVRIIGTGEELNPDAMPFSISSENFITTLQENRYVWHIFFRYICPSTPKYRNERPSTKIVVNAPRDTGEI